MHTIPISIDVKSNSFKSKTVRLPYEIIYIEDVLWRGSFYYSSITRTVRPTADDGQGNITSKGTQWKINKPKNQWLLIIR